MLEKPELPDDSIIHCLREAFGIPIHQIDFLPLGADSDSAVYRAVTADGVPYFVKLRSGNFDENAVTVPRLLGDRGLRSIIPPLSARTGRLWAEMNPFRVILYPYVEGQNGYRVRLTDSQWAELGSTLRQVHAVIVPPALAGTIRREGFSPRWRQSLRAHLERVEREAYGDPAAAELAAFLKLKRGVILELVERAERHAAALRARPPAFVLCHSDVHAGNVLIDGNDNLYIVDWDQPIFAPKERDLMVPGGAQGFIGHMPEEEEVLFFRGYGPVEIDLVALAYYRFERILEDIALYCDDLLLSDAGGADRFQALRYVLSNFLAGGTVEMAYRAE